MIFDEFYQMARMDVVDKALSLSGGCGVLRMVAIRVFGQLRKLYQSEATFIYNFVCHGILLMNDVATSEKIERILGKATQRQTDVNYSGNVEPLHHRDESLHAMRWAAR